MSAETETNQIDSEGRGRSTAKGDVPERLRRRYYLDERGGAGLGFYVDAKIQGPAFRDRGAQLVASRSDPNAIRDMTEIARHRGWTQIVVRGETDFRREAWLAAMAIGIDARGYQPGARDRQELERRIIHASRRTERGSLERENVPPRRDDGAATLKVIETVVRARVAARPEQERILQAARTRVAAWLERGAGLDPLETSASRARSPGVRERQRNR